MLVSIITDASHSHTTLCGGYGYWIVCERGRKQGGGPLKGRTPDSGTAEFFALVNALHIARSAGLVRAGDTVLFQTDSTEAIHYVKNPDKVKAKVVDASAKFLELTADLKVSIRHVKGHTKRNEPRFFVNRYCDSQAKKGRRAAERLLGKTVQTD